jgi:hypothetical protein
VGVPPRHTLTFRVRRRGRRAGRHAQTAETVYAVLSPEQQAIARDIFIRLTELGEGTEDTRRRAAWKNCSPTPHAPPVRTVLMGLADARLVTTAAGTAEVAHEALIREWSCLREVSTRPRWLASPPAFDRWRRVEAAERDAGVLYRGARLAQAQAVKTNARALNRWNASSSRRRRRAGA